MKTMKTMMVMVCMIMYHVIHAQTLVESFSYKVRDTGQLYTLGLYQRGPNDYYAALVGADPLTGQVDGVVINGVDESPFGSQNLLMTPVIAPGGCDTCIARIDFSIQDLTTFSQLVFSVNRISCGLSVNSCTFFTGDTTMKATWSNEHTGPVVATAPEVSQSITINTPDTQLLLNILGYPNGKIYQTDYKSDDRLPYNQNDINDNEAVLVDGTQQTIYIGDPSLSNKRSPIEVTVDADVSTVISAQPGVGINTTMPSLELDVHGLGRFLLRDDQGRIRSCSEATRGAIAYDQFGDVFVGCTRNGWQQLTTQ